MRTVFSLVVVFSLFPAVLLAADDPSIKEPQRSQIQAAMQTFIDDITVDGVLRHFDPVTGKVLELREANLHAGIVRKGDFLVSCADFTDGDGRRIDVDFLVLEAGSDMRAVQALVHKVDGEKRPYDLGH